MRGPRPSSWLIPLFIVSGANGLCFEILWARQLQVVVGATSKAVTAVVSIFMVGLALGGALGARWTTRLRRPAWGYGAAELGIGTSALAVTALLPRLEALPSVPLRYVLAALLLLLPSTLMGLTFPFVVQAADPQGRSGGGVLYAGNTAGATLGCVLAGFLGIGLIGISGTAVVAATFNLACGVIALVLFRGEFAAAVERHADSVPVSLSPQVRPLPILVASGLCGGSALAVEIVWTRALLPHLNSSTYAFAAIMATYLCGLALGSAWVARRCRTLVGHGLALLFGALQVVIALSIALAPRLMRASEVIPVYVGIRQVTSLGAWLAMVAAVFARTAWLVLVPTIAMGASLPLCIAMLVQSGRRAGAAAGQVSAINTVSGVLGSLGAGFLLLPYVGSVNSLAFIGLGNLAAALMVLWPVARARRQERRLVAAVGVAILVLFALRPADTTPFIGRLAAGSRTLLVDEGPQDTTAVIEHPAKERVILSNGVSYAGDAPLARRYMALLGHLPALIAETPDKALVICVGTGTTAANLALYREVRALDLVDISPVVHRTLPLFEHVNHRVWTDPRVTIHEADGRQFMTRAGSIETGTLGGFPNPPEMLRFRPSRKAPHTTDTGTLGAVPNPPVMPSFRPSRKAPQSSYGVITLEPPPPRAAGAASLYTVGLYQRARASLAPGGVIAQWLPLHGMTETEILMLARTFLAVFPDAALFVLNRDEAALIGSPQPLVFDGERMARRLADPAVRFELRQIGFAADDPDRLLADLLALAVVAGEPLRVLVGRGPLVTDDRPLIEQFATLLGDAGDPDGRRGLLRRLERLPEPTLVMKAAAPAGLAAARAELRAQVRAWLVAATQTGS